MAFFLRVFTDADIDEVDEIIKLAYNNPLGRKETLSQYLELQPDGAFVVQENDRLIGFGAALNYGAFSYVGLMSVHPAAQKRGVGHLLVERLKAWSAEQGCSTVILDSSQAGKALYLRCGFTEDDRTLHFRHVQHKTLPDTSSVAIFPVETQGITKLVAFDKAYFGASREVLLSMYAAHNPQRMFVSRGNNGEITGYIVAQERTIGPWVAHSLQEAEALLCRALTLPYASEPTVFTSMHNNASTSLLIRYGFEQARALSHMRIGPPVQRGRTTGLYGQASLGFG